MMGLGLVAEGCFCSAWLKVIEKFVGQGDFSAEEGSAGVDQSCFRMKGHSHQGAEAIADYLILYPVGGGENKWRMRREGIFLDGFAITSRRG